jgi:hypothetical protein
LGAPLTLHLNPQAYMFDAVWHPLCTGACVAMNGRDKWRALT